MQLALLPSCVRTTHKLPSASRSLCISYLGSLKILAVLIGMMLMQVFVWIMPVYSSFPFSFNVDCFLKSFLNLLQYSFCLGLPTWLIGNESPANAGDLGSIPGSGRPPGGGHGNPLQYSCLENPMFRGAWWATVQGSQRVRHAWACTHTLLLFYVLVFFFALEVYEILASSPGIKPKSLTLEGRVLTTGPLAKPRPWVAL